MGKVSFVVETVFDREERYEPGDEISVVMTPKIKLRSIRVDDFSQRELHQALHEYLKNRPEQRIVTKMVARRKGVK